MHRLSSMPQDSIHAEILKNNIADALQHPSYGNWADGIVKQYPCLGMALPFQSSGMTSDGFHADTEGQLCNVWNGLHVLPRTALTKGIKL